MQALREQLAEEPESYLHHLLATGSQALNQAASIVSEIRESKELLAQLTSVFFKPFHDLPAGEATLQSSAQVKQEVKELLQQAQKDYLHSHTASTFITQTTRLIDKWGESLFNCYDIPALPPNNANLESRFNRLRRGQRRISGRKKTTELRRSAHLQLLLHAETKEQLLEQFRCVSEEAYLRARISSSATEKPLCQLARLRRKPYETASSLVAEYLAIRKNNTS